MAGMNTQVMSRRQTRMAEQVAGYGAEQRRLKEAAAGRRAAAALRAAVDEETDRGLSARRARPPASARRSQYLR
jgi:hypothetical protein